MYLPVVDRGIDCIIRSDGEFFEIQIKTRHTAHRGKYIFDVRHFEARPNFFIVCYQARLYPNDLWIIPSKVFKEFCYEKNDVCRLVLNPKTQKALEKYKNNIFSNLRNIKKLICKSLRSRLKVTRQLTPVTPDLPDPDLSLLDLYLSIIHYPNYSVLI